MFHRVLICGDRNWDNFPFMEKAMSKWREKFDLPGTIIEGCARGADEMAGHLWVPTLNKSGTILGEIVVEHFPAKWNEHDSYGQTCWCRDRSAATCRGAGPLRNQAMLDSGVDAVIAFHTNIAASKGTADMVRRARAAGIKVWIPYPQPQQRMAL